MEESIKIFPEIIRILPFYMQKEFILPSFRNIPIYIKCTSPAEEEYSVDWHFHEYVEMIWVQEKEMQVFVDNQLFVLEKNDILFINSFVPHKTHTNIGNVKFLLQFKPLMASQENAPSAALLQPNSKQSNFAIFRNSTEINQILVPHFDELAQEFLGKKKSYAAFIRATIFDILAVLYRFDVLNDPEELALSSKVERLLPALQYIHEHVGESIPLDEMSALLHVSRSSFCRLFKETLNISFMEYVYLVRIQTAENLLLHTDYSITEIAGKSGFSSPAYFSMIFKEKKGYTPSFYKKLKKK